jgi:putative NADH-flavin reductase
VSALAVVAATGRTGRLVVELALAAGHEVTAVARRPDDLDIDHARLVRRAADAGEPHTLRAALAGHDTVISALGSAGRAPTTVYSDGTAAIVAALRPDARLMVISSAGLAVPADAGPGTRLLGRVLRQVMRHPYADMARMEGILASTDLAWTAVRPSGLTDRPGTGRPGEGRPRASLDATERLGHRTSRRDLAAYLVDHLDDPATFGHTVAVSS